MATTLEKISQILTSHDIKHRVDTERGVIFTGFQTEVYENQEGRRGLAIVIALEEDGEFIKIMAPRCYEYKDGPHKGAVFQACLMISYLTKLIQFEYDPDDGEIRAMIEFPLEDAELTDRQLMRCVSALPAVLDEYHDVITGAISKGTVLYRKPETAEELMRLFRQFLRERRRQKQTEETLELEE